MIANEIDVVNGKFGSKDVPIVVGKTQIKTFEAAGFPWECKMVKCPGLSADGFISNNDINLMANCFEVDFSKDDCLQIHAAPRFRQFAFDKAENRTIKVVSLFDYSIYGATSYVYLLFNKFEMQQFKFWYFCTLSENKV